MGFSPRLYLENILRFFSQNNPTGLDKWKIPERLVDIPTADDPQFFNMVEYYFHKACVLAEERLIGQVSPIDKVLFFLHTVWLLDKPMVILVRTFFNSFPR